jgi:hypothetical protein
VWLAAFTASASVAANPAAAGAQAGNVPRGAFSPADFARLRWLQGDWAGTAVDEAPTYQRFRFTDDTTIAITYYRDPAFSQEVANGRVYLSVGRIYHTFGSNRWAAARVDSSGLYLVPQMTARNNYSWVHVSPDAWTSTMRTGVSGHQRVIVYNMKRVAR